MVDQTIGAVIRPWTTIWNIEQGERSYRQRLWLCHSDGMANKARKRIGKSKRKSTEWGIGQPLAFPKVKNLTGIDRLAQEVVEEAMRGPFKPKREKRKKK